MNRIATRLGATLGIALAVTLLAAEAAEARRGGSFGSRGAKTFQAPPRTRTAPEQTAPVQKSMTAPTKAGPQAQAPAAGAAAQAPGRRGLFGGMGGGLLAGLAAGGLLGLLLGHGFGGMAGLGPLLFQLAIVAVGAWLLMALFRRRPAAAPAGMARDTALAGAGGPRFEPAGPRPQPYVPPAPETAEIGLVQADRDAFERLLGEVQDAFAREDFAALRERATPEIVSYLSEELSENAVQGRRNEVSDVRLLEADVAEAWREGDAEYATAAMRYESIDVMRDRQTGAVVSGDPDRATQTTELWTFVRRSGQPWKLSAIQEA